MSLHHGKDVKACRFVDVKAESSSMMRNTQGGGRHVWRILKCLLARFSFKWNNVQDTHMWPLKLWIMQVAMWEVTAQHDIEHRLRQMTGKDKHISHCKGSLCKADIVSLLSVREQKKTNGGTEKHTLLDVSNIWLRYLFHSRMLMLQSLQVLLHRGMDSPSGSEKHYTSVTQRPGF